MYPKPTMDLEFSLPVKTRKSAKHKREAGALTVHAGNKPVVWSAFSEKTSAKISQVAVNSKAWQERYPDPAQRDVTVGTYIDNLYVGWVYELMIIAIEEIILRHVFQLPALAGLSATRFFYIGHIYFPAGSSDYTIGLTGKVYDPLETYVALVTSESSSGAELSALIWIEYGNFEIYCPHSTLCQDKVVQVNICSAVKFLVAGFMQDRSIVDCSDAFDFFTFPTLQDSCTWIIYIVLLRMTLDKEQTLITLQQNIAIDMSITTMQNVGKLVSNCVSQAADNNVEYRQTFDQYFSRSATNTLSMNSQRIQILQKLFHTCLPSTEKLTFVTQILQVLPQTMQVSKYQDIMSLPEEWQRFAAIEKAKEPVFFF